MVFNFVKRGFEKVKNALAKSRSFLKEKLRAIFRGKIDEQTLESLEQLLYEADLGVDLAEELTEKVREELSKNPKLDSETVIKTLEEEILSHLEIKAPERPSVQAPRVILIVGVNGNGKTTTIAKLAKRFKDEGQKVLLAAADTYRAAAQEQLAIWAERLGVDIIRGIQHSDPAAVAYDAVSAAVARKVDTLIIDTAGRLHSKTDLMRELEKIKRSCAKVNPGSPHEIFLVLDSTTGQNAIDQAKTFNQYTPITGLIMTKLDGTAKGGIAINIHRHLKIPILYLGVGEGVDDLENFEPKSFVKALFE